LSDRPFTRGLHTHGGKHRLRVMCVLCVLWGGLGVAEALLAYCDKVEHTAEWGGQLELRALVSHHTAQAWARHWRPPLEEVRGREGTHDLSCVPCVVVVGSATCCRCPSWCTQQRALMSRWGRSSNTATPHHYDSREHHTHIHMG
jgi:hypothetical protein